MEIFIVGGAVRDGLLGKSPKDVDYVVVGATSQDMIDLGYSQVGADFPVFLHPKSGDEYALARTERKIGAGYHGFEVTADSSTTLSDDLSRRDLTINAMAMNQETGEVHDPFNGHQDLQDKVLRHVSPAFAEDPLRVVRLARFYARFSDFTIAPETVEIAKLVVLSGELDDLPHERFWAELEKVMEEENSHRFFEAVWLFGMDEHVQFFRELYGKFVPGKLDQMKKIMEYTAVFAQDPKDRMMYHTALTASVEAETINSATVATQILFRNIQRVRILTKTVDNIFDVLHAAKAFSQASDTKQLILTMAIAEHAGEKFAVDYQVLGAAWKAAQQITSEAYIQNFSGKALGEAIKQGRKAAIAKCFQPASAE